MTSSARHAGLLVVHQPEAPVALVLRGVVGGALPALVSVRHHAQHEGLGVADDGAQGGGAVHSLADLSLHSFQIKM